MSVCYALYVCTLWLHGLPYDPFRAKLRVHDLECQVETYRRNLIKKPWAYDPKINSRIHIRNLIKAQGFSIRFLHYIHEMEAILKTIMRW